MINQRAYPDIILGFGTTGQTIAKYGCYMASLLNGLVKRNYVFSVPQWNEYLKAHSTFQGTLLSSTRIAATCPDIFLEGRNEAWDDANLKKYLTDKSYIVLGEVDARGIGGSGQHFVDIDHCDFKPDGKVAMSYIDDPWDGLEDQKVTTRYNLFGNILSFRVFKIKQGGGMPETITVNKSDWDRLMKASQLGDRLIQGLGESGNIADKDQVFIDNMISKWKQIETDKNNAQSDLAKVPQQLIDAEKKGYDKGFIDGVASVPTPPPTPPSTEPTQPESPIDLTKYDEVGVSVETTEDNAKYIRTYKKKV